MILKNKKIALVGGAGFIGHNLAMYLKNLGAEIHIIDGLEVNNLTSVISNRDNLPNPELSKEIIFNRLDLIKKNNISLYVKDARDYNSLSMLITDINPDIIVHLAAISHANKSNKDPYSTFDHSFRTLENALDISRNRNVKHFIYFSSSMVYGNFQDEKVDENSNCNPLGIYGALKYSGEKVVIAYNQVFNLPYTIIRPSALYGERCISRRVGQIFIENALSNKEITISGSGKDKLDFTYIEDLCSGVAKIIENKNSINQIFNLTYGAARSINDMVDLLLKDFPKIKINYTKRDKLMPERGTLSVDKAKKLLGYEPKFSLEKGFPKYINWYKDFYKKI